MSGCGSGCDAWLLHYRTNDPLTHAAGWLRPARRQSTGALRGGARPLARRTCASAGIEAIGYGAVVLRRRERRGELDRDGRDAARQARARKRAHAARVRRGGRAAALGDERAARGTVRARRRAPARAGARVQRRPFRGREPDARAHRGPGVHAWASTGTPRRCCRTSTRPRRSPTWSPRPPRTSSSKTRSASGSPGRASGRPAAARAGLPRSVGLAGLVLLDVPARLDGRVERAVRLLRPVVQLDLRELQRDLIHGGRTASAPPVWYEVTATSLNLKMRNSCCPCLPSATVRTASLMCFPVAQAEHELRRRLVHAAW